MKLGICPGRTHVARSAGGVFLAMAMTMAMAMETEGSGERGRLSDGLRTAGRCKHRDQLSELKSTGIDSKENNCGAGTDEEAKEAAEGGRSFVESALAGAACTVADCAGLGSCRDALSPRPVLSVQIVTRI
jgi:hypothetical protein